MGVGDSVNAGSGGDEMGKESDNGGAELFLLMYVYDVMKVKSICG